MSEFDNDNRDWRKDGKNQAQLDRLQFRQGYERTPESVSILACGNGGFVDAYQVEWATFRPFSLFVNMNAPVQQAIQSRKVA